MLGLGTWALWEWILSLLPLRVPVFVQLPIVALLAWALHECPLDLVRLCLAVAGIVAILHVLIVRETPVVVGRRGGGRPADV